MRTLIQTIVLSGTLACASFPALIGMGTSGGTVSASEAVGTIGFAFSVNTAVNVTALGYWDEGGDGLVTSHDIGLWDSTGTLIATLIVPNGTGGTLQSGFRFVNLGAPVALAVGNYVLGGFTGVPPTGGLGDRFLIEPTLAVAPQLSFGQDRFITGASLALPTQTSPFLSAAFFGPNLLIEVPVPPNGDVPEPSTLVSMIGGMVFVAFGLHRRRRNVTGPTE